MLGSDHLILVGGCQQNFEGLQFILDKGGGC